MTTNELRILEIIWDWGGEASVDIIARTAGVSIDYARLLCESLSRGNHIDFLNFKLCKIRRKGKLEIIKYRDRNPSQIVINKNSLGLGRSKRGRLTINY